MPTISKSTLTFLQSLKKNNNREWFMDNKPRYEEAKAEFEIFVDALIAKISGFDPAIGHHRAKDCIFRIYRDVRFSKDKSPYKTHLGAHITPAAKRSEVHSRAGYYIHVEPGGLSMLAGGAYMPQGDWLKAIRKEIDYNTDQFKAILNNPAFMKYFGRMEGEKLKRAPKDYPIDHPDIELLKHKSFLATHHVQDQMIFDQGFLQHAAAVFEALFPFDDFLNRSTD